MAPVRRTRRTITCTARLLSLPLALAVATAAHAQGAPNPDPRVGLKPGKWDAAQAIWNMRLLSATKPPEKFVDGVNSDLAFTGNYVIQGSFNGFQVWDISNPSQPTLKTAFYCPASQSDVSTYKNLLFVSSESNSGRLDCGAGGVKDTVSHERIRGIRIFDISDIANPKYIGNVQTCRGSHTHSLLVDPKDKDNVYVYISGSAGVRSPNELAGCSRTAPDKDPNSALFRIEVIKVPLAHPEQAAIVSSPRIFNDLTKPATHGLAPEDIKAVSDAKARGAFTATIGGNEMVLPDGFVKQLLDSTVKSRGGTGAPTGADSAALRAAIPGMVAKMVGESPDAARGPKPGPTQCHDITLYPGIGLAGGACEGYGLLLDIRDPAHPTRLAAVADSNFSYWHSATFNNDGSKVLFSDEWGGGGAPKCRASDPKEWGADAIFTINNGKLDFQSYYKMPAPQTAEENCVAHNGSLIPIPGRDVMVQAWYQGGISVFDFTDAKHPQEIAFFDRGPIDSTRMVLGGSWSVYWYNGSIVSSEIVRGLDVLELVPSPMLTQNEIDAAKTVKFDYLNTQGQPKLVWPASFSLSRAYLDQAERSGGLAATRVAAVRQALASAESASGAQRKSALSKLASELHAEAPKSSDAPKVHLLATSIGNLANASAAPVHK
jgi:LVIVD repeat